MGKEIAVVKNVDDTKWWRVFFGKKHFREAPTHNDDHDHDHDHDELFLWYG